MKDIKTISQLFDIFLEHSDNSKILIGELRCVLNDILPIKDHITNIVIHDRIAYIKLSSSSLRHALKLKKDVIIDACHEKKILIDDIIVY